MHLQSEPRRTVFSQGIRRLYPRSPQRTFSSVHPRAINWHCSRRNHRQILHQLQTHGCFLPAAAGGQSEVRRCGQSEVKSSGEGPAGLLPWTRASLHSMMRTLVERLAPHPQPPRVQRDHPRPPCLTHWGLFPVPERCGQWSRAGQSTGELRRGPRQGPRHQH